MTSAEAGNFIECSVSLGEELSGNNVNRMNERE